MQQHPVGLPAEKHIGKRLCEKVIVLEDAQHQQVHRHIGPHPGLPARTLFACMPDGKTAEIGAERRESDQQQKPSVPPAVEEI